MNLEQTMRLAEGMAFDEPLLIEGWVDKQDEHGKLIIYDDGNFQIAKSSETEPTYISLWNGGKCVGKMYVELIERGSKAGWIKISLIDIDKKYRGLGYGSKMYQALQKSYPNSKGIYSYIPDRMNNKEVPRIYNKMGGHIEDSDHAYIPFKK